MGQTLSEPVREKHSANGHDERLMYASSAMQGWRISMEDAHTTLLQILDKKGYSFFGVYDGHGGQNVAKYSGVHLHDRIVKDSNFGKDIEKAIKNGFLGIDEDLRNDTLFQNDPSGCTAVTAVITPDDYIYVGNAGDSRAVLSVNGEAVAMSDDHKPLNKDESSRITKAGGFIEFGRVNGNLALSRAIGDFEFKQNNNLEAEAQIVTALPDVRREKIISDKTEFLVLACDGIWDCLTSQQVISFIRKNIKENKSLQKACEDLMDRCLAKDSELGGIGCDNMTVIIVAFLNGKTVQQWYNWMASRYGNLGPEYHAEDVKPQKQEDFQDMNDELEEDLEIPSTDEYTDTDLENQNQLTIDDVSRPERENSSDSLLDSPKSETPRSLSQHSSSAKSTSKKFDNSPSKLSVEDKDRTLSHSSYPGKKSLASRIAKWGQNVNMIIGFRALSRNNEGSFGNDGKNQTRKSNLCDKGFSDSKT
ncbi:5388_t:CDS:2 [Acaulospora morrowiae]|uniref:protein-serine/threonine phosphatase n=1 Tax=Acaulospora morrowiae TaxID=94023 RepID=A0A9N8VEN2_9GLOM|nr:5388_t:CDS:2 [Acaulospora morrowiae]